MDPARLPRKAIVGALALVAVSAGWSWGLRALGLVGEGRRETESVLAQRRPQPTRTPPRSFQPLPARDEPVRGVRVPEAGRFEVPLAYIPQMASGVRFAPGYPYPLTREAPAGVLVTPPGEDDILFGEVPLAGALRTAFAIVRPKDGSAHTHLYVDRNRDGDLTNDAPDRYMGGGEWASGATIAFDLLRDDGSVDPYRIWLWTSLRKGKAAGDRPGFNYYPWCHRRAELAFAGEETAVVVHASDPGIPPDGLWGVESLWIDWNRNRRSEPFEAMAPGDVRRFAGVTLRLRSIARHGRAATFEVNPIVVSEVVDIDAAIEAQPIVGNLAPPIEAPGLDGRPIDLAALRGRVVLVDFWATWCGPCLREMPNVKAAYERYHERGFEVVGVSLDGDVDRLREEVAARAIPWRQACDGRRWASPTAKRWQVTGIPAAFLIGRDGRIVATNLRGDSLAPAIERALEKR